MDKVKSLMTDLKLFYFEMGRPDPDDGPKKWWNELKAEERAKMQLDTQRCRHVKEPTATANTTTAPLCHAPSSSSSQAHAQVLCFPEAAAQPAFAVQPPGLPPCHVAVDRQPQGNDSESRHAGDLQGEKQRAICPIGDVGMGQGDNVEDNGGMGLDTTAAAAVGAPPLHSNAVSPISHNDGALAESDDKWITSETVPPPPKYKTHQWFIYAIFGRALCGRESSPEKQEEEPLVYVVYHSERSDNVVRMRIAALNHYDSENAPLDLDRVRQLDLPMVRNSGVEPLRQYWRDLSAEKQAEFHRRTQECRSVEGAPRQDGPRRLITDFQSCLPSTPPHRGPEGPSAVPDSPERTPTPPDSPDMTSVAAVARDSPERGMDPDAPVPVPKAAVKPSPALKGPAHVIGCCVLSDKPTVTPNVFVLSAGAFSVLSLPKAAEQLQTTPSRLKQALDRMYTFRSDSKKKDPAVQVRMWWRRLPPAEQERWLALTTGLGGGPARAAPRPQGPAASPMKFAHLTVAEHLLACCHPKGVGELQVFVGWRSGRNTAIKRETLDTLRQKDGRGDLDAGRLKELAALLPVLDGEEEDAELWWDAQHEHLKLDVASRLAACRREGPPVAPQSAPEKQEARAEPATTLPAEPPATSSRPKRFMKAVLGHYHQTESQGGASVFVLWASPLEVELVAWRDILALDEKGDLDPAKLSEVVRRTMDLGPVIARQSGSKLLKDLWKSRMYSDQVELEKLTQASRTGRRQDPDAWPATFRYQTVAQHASAAAALADPPPRAPRGPPVVTALLGRVAGATPPRVFVLWNNPKMVTVESVAEPWDNSPFAPFDVEKLQALVVEKLDDVDVALLDNLEEVLETYWNRVSEPQRNQLKRQLASCRAKAADKQRVRPASARAAIPQTPSHAGTAPSDASQGRAERQNQRAHAREEDERSLDGLDGRWPSTHHSDVVRAILGRGASDEAEPWVCVLWTDGGVAFERLADLPRLDARGDLVEERMRQLLADPAHPLSTFPVGEDCGAAAVPAAQRFWACLGAAEQAGCVARTQACRQSDASVVPAALEAAASATAPPATRRPVSVEGPDRKVYAFVGRGTLKGSGEKCATVVWNYEGRVTVERWSDLLVDFSDQRLEEYFQSGPWAECMADREERALQAQAQQLWKLAAHSMREEWRKQAQYCRVLKPAPTPKARPKTRARAAPTPQPERKRRRKPQTKPTASRPPSGKGRVFSFAGQAQLPGSEDDPLYFVVWEKFDGRVELKRLSEINAEDEEGDFEPARIHEQFDVGNIFFLRPALDGPDEAKAFSKALTTVARFWRGLTFDMQVEMGDKTQRARRSWAPEEGESSSGSDAESMEEDSECSTDVGTGEEDSVADDGVDRPENYENHVYCIVGRVNIVEQQARNEEYLARGRTRLWVRWGSGAQMTEDPLADVVKIDGTSGAMVPPLNVARLKALVPTLKEFSCSKDDDAQMVTAPVEQYWRSLTKEERRRLREQTQACRTFEAPPECVNGNGCGEDSEGEEDVGAVGGKRRLDLSFDPRKRLKTWEGARRLRDIKFREAQLQFLRSMRGKGAIVNLYGDAHTCKTVLARSWLEEEQLPHGFVTCAVVSKEEHLFEQCLKSLLGWFHTHWPVTDADYDRCPALKWRPCHKPEDFVHALEGLSRWMRQRAEGQGQGQPHGLTLLFDDVEFLLNVPGPLLGMLVSLPHLRAQLYQTQPVPWTILLITRQSLNSLRSLWLALEDPVPLTYDVEFPQYIAAQMEDLVLGHLVSRAGLTQPLSIHSHLAQLAVKLWYRLCLDLNDLATAAVRVYELWLEAQEAQGSPAGSDPTAPGLPRLEYSPWAAEAAPMDEDTPMKLPPAVQQEYTAAQVWDELEPYFKKVGDAFATFTKTPPTTTALEQAHQELVQTLSKANRLLLVAAFVSSHNPDASDHAKLSAQGERQSLREKKAELNRVYNEAVHTFTLDRLADNYVLISGTPAAQVREELHGQLLHLEPYHFITQLGHDPPRYRCLISRKLAADFGKSVNINLDNLLVTTKN
eukprot:EG_transcript_118